MSFLDAAYELLAIEQDLVDGILSKVVAARMVVRIHQRWPTKGALAWARARTRCRKLAAAASALAEARRDGRPDMSVARLRRRCPGFADRTYEAVLARALRDTVF